MSAIRSVLAARRPHASYSRAPALVRALFIGAVSLGAYAPVISGRTKSPASASAHAAPVDCADGGQDGVANEAFVQTELFFGTVRPDGPAVTAQEWSEFLDREITARFPDGLTVMTGSGRWREPGGDVVQERSMLVILLYPRDAARESSQKIEQIRTAYQQAFEQQSVLRSSHSLPVCVSF